MSVTVTVRTLPTAEDLLVTVTSLVASREPVPTEVSPTLRVTFPSVPLKPPNLALKLVTVTLEGKVVVKVMLSAGFLPDPI